MPSFCDYWTFVQTHPILDIGIFTQGGGIKLDFELFIQRGGTLQAILDDPEKANALKGDERIKRLLIAYMHFFRLENFCLNLSYRLEEQLKNYEQLEKK